MPAVRPPAVDGLFYPADAATLRRQIGELLSLAGTAAGDAGAAAAGAAAAARLPKLLIVPHAGYIYSGAIAASAYALLAPHAASVRRVVLLGPAHRVWVEGLAAPRAHAFATPLGQVPLDTAALDIAQQLPQVARDDRAHAQEHSLEVQLPFLQVLLGSFALVPLLVGDANADAVAQVLDHLWGDERTLLLISSDLSHYLPGAQAQAADGATARRILQLDDALTPEQACGARAINGALRCARRRRLRPRLLDLRNSGDTAGDRSRVVGYGAFAFDQEQPA